MQKENPEKLVYLRVEYVGGYGTLERSIKSHTNGEIVGILRKNRGTCIDLLAESLGIGKPMCEMLDLVKEEIINKHGKISDEDKELHDYTNNYIERSVTE